MAVDRDTVTVGTELPAFVRTTGFHNWNRYAAVNDEFIDIHMDDESAKAIGMPGVFGMGNLRIAYLHNLLADWLGDDGDIVDFRCEFRGLNLKGDTLTCFGARAARLTYDMPACYLHSYAAAIAHFVECLRSGAPFETAALDNLRTLELVEAAYAAEGRA